VSASILFADVPGFYAEVERATRPDLAGRPVVVGGDPRKRGLVQAATRDAEAAGVVVGMPVELALTHIRGAKALRTDMPRYREMDKRFRACVGRTSERLEPAGLGAAFLDVSGLAEPLDALAAALRDRVSRELGLPLRTGAAPVKFVARLAAEEAGPGDFRAVAAADVSRFLAPLAVSRLPGVGPNTVAKLAEIDAPTIGALVGLPRAVVEAQLGNRGLELLAAALGRGDDRVRAARHPQTLSQEATLAAGEVDRAVLGEQLRGLAERLERALGLEGLVARRLVLKLRYEDGQGATRSQSFERGLAAAGDLVEQGQLLLGRTHAGVRPIRLLGLAATNLERPRRDERQLSLFEPS
jgi:nucleotidyltransferase/DNA polymerase involved in DNA repair